MAKNSKKTSDPGKAGEPIRKEIGAIIFLLLAIILGVSLLSYYPADPLLWTETARAGKAQNLFGTFGAHLAGGIFFLLGFSSFWLVILCLIMTFLFFRGQALASPVKDLLAGLFLILSSAGILSLQMPKTLLYRGGHVMSGGLVGIHVGGQLKDLFNYFGAYVFLVAVLIISLMFCTGISFGWIFAKFSAWVASVTINLREYRMKRGEKNRKKRVRESLFQQEKVKPKPKVTIVEPKKEPVKKPEQESFAFMDVAGQFKLPSLELLDKPPVVEDVEIQRESLEMNARRVEKKLADFGVNGEVVEILPGPVITMFEFKPAPGIKISKVAGLSDDLALALRAQSVRIVAPIPGKSAIGIEIPNNKRLPVYLSEILASPAYKESENRLGIALGKDITGMPFVTDLARMPHLLVAGATGSGKSVCLNAIINSFLFKASPDMVRLLVIDPKRIELSIYKDIPHLLHPVVTEPKEANRALRWAVEEMERRYMLLSDRGVRHIDAYNRKIQKEKTPVVKDDAAPPPKRLPYIIVVIDELADLMMVSSKDVEESITRLAQMARAAGIHLVIATQRPSVDVLTGIIKANFPARISFQVSSRVDSRTILDCIGAENLLGDGDMLFQPPGVGRLQRIHGAYISEEEVKNVTNFLREQMKPDYDASIVAEVARDEEVEEEDIELDEKYEQAVDLVMHTGQASISMVQRKLRVGYNRAARMIEAMEKQGIVGPSDGVKAREVFRRREE